MAHIKHTNLANRPFACFFLSGRQIFVEALKEKGLDELVMILIETSLIKVAIQAINLIIMLIVYGRMFEIYVYCSASSIPFATIGNKE